MRAVRFVDGQVTLADVARPGDTPGGVRVRVRAAGICGSDLSMLAAHAFDAPANPLGFTGDSGSSG